MSRVANELTQRERQCLRLVSRGMSSKEIAVELGISHHTVDLHLRRAIRATGSSTRRDAARALSLSEGDGPPLHTQLLSTHPAALADAPDRAASSPPEDTQLELRVGLPFIRRGRRRNDLTPLQRLMWIPLLAIALLFVIANFFNALGALWTITS